MESTLPTPSTHQRRILRWVREGSGHGIVHAVAGSGKTTTLVMAGREIGSEGIFLAFNKHIAETLDEKLRAVGMQGRTIHSLGMEAIRRSHPGVEVAPQKYWPLVFRLVDKHFTRRAQFAIKKEYGVAVSTIIYRLFEGVRQWMLPFDTEAAIEEVQRRLQIPGPPHVFATAKHVLPALHSEGFKARSKTIDYMDMVWYPARGYYTVDKYPWVFVDEVQDLSPVRRKVVLDAIDPSGGRCLGVGDAAQAIYAFAGADPDSMETTRSILEADEFPLPTCFRCARKVVELAAKFQPEIEPAADAATGIVREIKVDDFREAVAEGDMVLSRRAFPLIRACVDTIAAGTPARVVGHDMDKQFLDTAKAAANLARGWSLSGIFLSLPRLVELRKDAARAGALAKRRAEVASAVEAAGEKVDEAPPEDEDPQLEQERLAETLSAEFERITDTVEATRALLEHLLPETEAEFRQRLREIFAGPREDVVQFSTVHKAKGLEAPRVFLIEPERMPLWHPKMTAVGKAQERNLQYVACTRAKTEFVFVGSPWPEAGGPARTRVIAIQLEKRLRERGEDPDIDELEAWVTRKIAEEDE